MTTSWWRSAMRYLQYSGDDMKRLHKLSYCWGCRICCVFVRMRFDDCRNLQFSSAVPLILFTEVVGRIPPSQLCQFVKLHLLPPTSLHALLYRFRDCAHHPAGFIIFSQLALLCICIMFPILLIVWTCKITQTVSNSIQHLLKQLSGPPGGQPPASSTS